MGIGQIFSCSAVKTLTSFVKAHPIAVSVGAGAVGLVAYKVATSTPKENHEQMNRMILTNPLLNPTGYFYHSVNPSDTTPNYLDGMSGMMVNKNNERFNTVA